MKNKISILVLASIVLLVFSCGETKTEKEEKVTQKRKATNLSELVDKFEDVKFESCDDFFEANHEMIDVYVQTVIDAYHGSNTARDNIEKIERFIADFDDQEEKFKKKCPEDYDAFKREVDGKVLSIRDKLIEIYTRMEFELEWDETLSALEEEINSSLREVEDQIKKEREEKETQSDIILEAISLDEEIKIEQVKEEKEDSNKPVDDR